MKTTNNRKTKTQKTTPSGQPQRWQKLYDSCKSKEKKKWVPTPIYDLENSKINVYKFCITELLKKQAFRKITTGLAKITAKVKK